VDERLHIEAVRLFIENCKFRKALNEVSLLPNPWCFCARTPGGRRGRLADGLDHPNGSTHASCCQARRSRRSFRLPAARTLSVSS